MDVFHLHHKQGLIFFSLCRKDKQDKFPAEHSAVGNRDARFVFNIAGSWEKAEDDTKNIQWVRDSWEDMKKFSTGGTYINFLTEDDGDDRVQAAFGTGMDRLAEIKSKWDPENIFRTNRNIRVK